MRLLKSKIALLIITVLICFILCEISVRLLSNTDLDGNIIYRDVQFKPYKLPQKETEKKLLQYSREEINSRLLFDQKLGWRPHDNFISSDRMYIYNKYGFRCGSLSDTTQNNEAVRIMIFGDSYAHGDEVNFTGTIGYFLKNLFLDNNIHVEVLNFGVSGYGMDQVYLRWENVKDKYKPDIVIFGAQFENVKRNINIIRPLYSSVTEIPFTKPRFIIKNNKFTMIDNPSNTINDMSNILNNFENWELKNYEGFYNQDDYKNSFVFNSQLIAFVDAAYSRIFGEYEYFAKGSESFDVTMQIINRFKLSVEKVGSQFVLVHFPVINDFALSNYLFSQIMYDQDLIYESLLYEIQANADLIEIYPYLKRWIENNSTSELFMTRHYSQTANKLIAKRIYNYLNLNYKIFSRR